MSPSSRRREVRYSENIMASETDVGRACAAAAPHILNIIDHGGDVDAVRAFLLAHVADNDKREVRGGVEKVEENITVSKPRNRPSSSLTKIVPMLSSHNPVLDREEATLCLFSELMKKRQVVATPPSCETSLKLATRVDVAKVAKGYVSVIMSMASEEEAVTKCLAKYPLLRELNNAHPEHFEELLVRTGVRILKDSR